jgi:hypothetical protein
MDHPPPSRRATSALGLHLADDAARLAPVELDGRGRPRLASWATVPVPVGCIVSGLVRRAGHLPAAAIGALRRSAAGEPVRVSLATPDVVCVPFGEGRGDPVAALARRLPPGDPGDALWADAVSILGTSAGLAGARRSTVQRTHSALTAAGLAVGAIEPMPAGLVAVMLSLVDLAGATWTAQVVHAGTMWRVTVGRGGRLEAGAVPAPAGARPGLSLQVHGDATPVADVAQRIRRGLGRGPHDLTDEELPAVIPAVGAALGGLDGPVAAPDLAAAVVVRPLGSVDPLPRWAVEGFEPQGGVPTTRRARREAP